MPRHNYKVPTYPVPILSKKNVEFINSIIDEKKIDFIIEYGSGYSTMYFIKNLKKKKIKFISVENTKTFFYKNIKTLSKEFNPKNCILEKSYWNKEDYEKIYKTSLQPFTKIIDGTSRLEKIKAIVQLGFFYRFSESQNSRLSKILSPINPILRPIYILLNSLLLKLKIFNNEKSKWQCQIDELDFIYKLVSPGVKDQFGECANRDDYVNSGIDFLENENENKNILVMIDGGPRHYILDKILNSKYKQNFHVCLFDAYRPEYKIILDKYKGTFYSGEDQLIDGTNFYSIFQNEEHKKYRLDKELWYLNYQN
jgi:hypothetical protein